MMPKFKLVALSNAVEGAETEFNRWYREEHLSDVSAIEGVTAAHFHKFAAGNDRWGYMAIYDVEAEDPAHILAEIKRRSGTNLMPVSPSLSLEDVFFGTFVAVE
jgi:hypothetical protein